MAGYLYEQDFVLGLWQYRLEVPLRWYNPRVILVDAMSNLVHNKIDRSFVDGVFDVMERADRHVFHVLTKRSSLMRNYVRARYDGGTVSRYIWPACRSRIQLTSTESRI